MTEIVYDCRTSVKKQNLCHVEAIWTMDNYESTFY